MLLAADCVIKILSTFLKMIKLTLVCLCRICFEFFYILQQNPGKGTSLIPYQYGNNVTAFTKIDNRKFKCMTCSVHFVLTVISSGASEYCCLRSRITLELSASFICFACFFCIFSASVSSPSNYKCEYE